jgi:hypothetical protein
MSKLNIISIAGGLGNQMFQYAFYLSLKVKEPKSITKVYIAKYSLHNGYELDTVFDIKKHLISNLISGFLKKMLKKWTLKIQDLAIGTYTNFKTDASKIVYYSGYWQSEKYFKNAEDIIRQQFTFKRELLNKKNIELLTQFSNKNTVSVHIRRGDYVTNTDANILLGGLCDLSYYEKAISFIEKNVRDPYFYFFSDDIEWAKNHFSNLKNVYFVDWNHKADSWQDMFLMSKCTHNIIANSSFSWWGAWLNDNMDKIVIAPSKWFRSHETLDILPENWTKI